jgi:hypothetical protein
VVRAGQPDDIHHELDAQIKHVAQIQQQMDEVRAMVRRLSPSPPTS